MQRLSNLEAGQHIPAADGRASEVVGGGESCDELSRGLTGRPRLPEIVLV